jgi:serine/threonine-protein kinase
MSDVSYPELPTNTHFDHRYAPLSPLGSGGVGEVMLYSDRWIGREVALKTLRVEEGESTGSTSERFLREARVQGQLEHPSIVPVYECGVRPDGREYFTMKRVRGTTFAKAIRAQSQSGGRRRLLEAFARVCLAVDFAHARGIVHRDLKPTNIMLGDFGEVYVLDWGVAKVPGAREAPSSPVAAEALPPGGATEPGTWLGTPGYMAPEQLEGGEVSPRTDVYALGVILFELLTGEPLHGAGPPFELVRSTRGGVEARPSERCPELGVPPEFDPILASATARNPLDRYPTARALSEEVERFLDGDRDLSLRRELGGRHARAAEVAAASDQHAEALRNVGRALALDPNNADAVRLLGRLLLHEPAEEPAEVRALVEQSAAALRRRAVGTLFFRSLSWAAFIPITAWLGYTAPRAAWLIVGAVAGTAALLWALRRLVAVTPRTLLGLLLVTSALFATLSAMFGPFILIPALVATNTIFFVLHAPPAQRWLILLVGVLTVLLPFAVELAGLVPPSYEFLGGEILVRPRALAFPVPGTQLMLVLAHVALVLAPAFVATRVHDALLAAERRLFLYGWRVSQLAVDLPARDLLTLGTKPPSGRPS